MKEDRKAISEQESLELKGRLSRLAHMPIVKGPLEAEKGTWLVKPSGLPLDIAFVQKGSSGDIEKMAFLGLKLCGKENVVGISIRQGKSGVEHGLKLLERNQNIKDLEKRGARVLVMTPGELKNWVEFYEQVETTGLKADLGPRALEFSGLEWLSGDEADEQDKSLQAILDKEWDYLKKFGVVDVSGDKAADMVFLNGRGKPVAFPVFHASTPSMQGQLMVETVEEDKVLCGGFVVRKLGETERELALRSELAEDELSKRIGREVKIVRINSNQVNLWQKMGFSENWGAIDTESGISAEEVVRFLYLGESNVNPGILSRYPFNLSLPSRGGALSFPDVDVVFWGKNPNGSRRVRSIDNLLVHDKKGENMPLSNVAGIRIFGDKWSFEEMNDYTKPYKKDLAYRTGIPGAFILNLTPDLFDQWREQGTPFFQGEIKQEISLEKRLQYFMPGVAESIYYFQTRQKEEIGGNKNGLIMLDARGNSVTHLFDLGMGFTDMPIGFNGIGKAPNSADGLLRLFRTGLLPMVAGWWEKEYLKQTVLKISGLAYPSYLEGDIVAQYVTTELLGRCTEEELRATLPKAIANNILTRGKDYMKKWGRLQERIVDTVTPTHGHWDHIGLFPYMNSEVRQILSGPEIGFVNAITAKAPSWRNRITDRKMLTKSLVKNAYQTEQVDIEPFYFSGSRIRLSSQLVYEPHFVTHSAPGLFQIYEATTKNGGTMTFFNSGDFNVDREKSVFKVAEKLSGRADVLTMEATNAGSEKAYVGRTEADVRDTMLKLIKESGNDIVVAIAPINNMTRIKGLLEVAEASGRKLALSFPHAEFALQMAAAKEISPKGAEGFDDVLPYELGEGNLTLWAKKMSKPKPYHNALLEIASRGELGVLTPERLSRENGKWIVVASPYDVLEDQFDGIFIKDSMRLVWMSSFLYSREQKMFLGANNRWLKGNRKIKFIADMQVHGQGGQVESKLYGSGVLHVSGHATSEEMVAITDILIGPDRKNIPVIINHSESPELAGKILKARLGDRVDLITKLDRYDPNDPLGHPGFFLKLV